MVGRTGDGGRSEWLTQFLTAVQLEAGRLGHELIDGCHFIATAVRKELGMTAMLGAAGVDVDALRGLAARVGRPPAKERRPHAPPTTLAFDARGVLALASDEAQTAGEEVGPAHVLVGLAKVHVAFGAFGVFTNDIRRAAGLPVPVPAPAPVVPPIPQRAGRLVIDGGSPPAPQVARVLDLAGSSRSSPTVAHIGAAFPWGGRPIGLARAVEEAGGRLVDTDSVEATFSLQEVCDVVADADVVYLASGYPRYVIDYLAGTPVGKALVAASDAGAVVWGASAGAMALGVGGVDPSGDDGPAFYPGLGWVEAAVFPHYQGDPHQVDMHVPLRGHLNEPVLLVPHEGVVLAERGWNRFTQFVADPVGVGPWWWPPDHDAPHPLNTSRSENAASAGSCG